MTLAAVSAAMAVVPGRVGPVSAYGELKAKGGRLVGSCPSYSDKTVQVKGMSLFWSSAADSALVYYTSQAMGLMVQDMGIEVLRFALGVADEKFDSHGRSYTTGGKNDQKAMVTKMVRAAVENDIYIILDWHIESSSGYTHEDEVVGILADNRNHLVSVGLHGTHVAGRFVPDFENHVVGLTEFLGSPFKEFLGFVGIA